MFWLSPTCHDSSVVLTWLEGTLALPCLHPHPSIVSLLQGEGGYILQDNRVATGEVPSASELLNYSINICDYPDKCLFVLKLNIDF